MQRVKDPALSLLWHGFDPWPRTCGKKKKKRKEKRKKNYCNHTKYTAHNGIKSEVNNRRKLGKFTNMWILNNTLLKNKSVKEEIRREVRKYFEIRVPIVVQQKLI